MLPRPFFGFSEPLERGPLLVAAGALALAALGVAGLGYALALPLDSMGVMVAGLALAAGAFALGLVMLVFRRLRAMGVAPRAGVLVWALALFFGVQLMDMRALPAKLAALPLLALALAPFVLRRWPEGKKNPPETGGS